VGGPTMVRAAAKNYNDVRLLLQVLSMRSSLMNYTRLNGSTSLDFRQKMSRTAFTETAYYDALISNYFNKITNNHFPEKKIIYGNLVEKLRYGENPHQESAIYSKNKSLDITQLHGKQLSYNNYNDIFAALTISKSLPKNTGVVIIKHANPLWCLCSKRSC
jgi:phosphoribosylaminoimidazolecarboxamide formyltransferase/IMP cyclohydrolase